MSSLMQFLSIAVLIACSHATMSGDEIIKQKLYGYWNGADGDMLLNGCPANMPHRYPGTNRCFQTVWGAVSCNVDVKNDPIPHHSNDQQCDFASTVDHYGIRNPNGCPSQMPLRYPGTDRCFEVMWDGGHCNINTEDRHDRSWNRKCLYDEPVYKSVPIEFTKPGQQIEVDGEIFPDFSSYMYNVICPVANRQMVEGWRCQTNTKNYPITSIQKGDICREYQKFVNEEQFEKYYEVLWTKQIAGADAEIETCMNFNPDEIEHLTTSEGEAVFAGLEAMGCCRTDDINCRSPLDNDDITKMKLYGYWNGADGDMLLNGCPANMPHRYPGTNRCFQTVWGAVSCNVDPKNDPISHHANDQQCDFASTVDQYGTRTSNGCPSQMPHRYPGTDRCFAVMWDGGHCNINTQDFHDRSWNRMCLYDEPVYRTIAVTFKNPGQPIMVDGDQYSGFNVYMYNKLCPIADLQMEECWRCGANDENWPISQATNGNVCREFYKFANVEQFNKYKEYEWIKPIEGNQASVGAIENGADVGLYDDIEASTAVGLFAGLEAKGCCRASDVNCRAPTTGRLLLEKTNLMFGDF